MTKRLLIILLFAACLFMLPVATQAASSEYVGIEQNDEKNEVQISVSRSSVHIMNRTGDGSNLVDRSSCDVCTY